MNRSHNFTHGGPGYDKPNELIETQDGGYAILGETHTPGNGDLWLLKLDHNGQLQWNKTYGGPNNDYGGIFIETEDDGFLISGKQYIPDVGGGPAPLIKTDSNGNIEWEVDIDVSSVSSPELELLVETDDGYIVWGTTFVEVNETEFTDAWLMKFDNDGNYEWNKTLDAFGEVMGAIVTDDGGYATCGWEGGWPVLNVTLTKLDATGDIEWKSIFDRAPDDECNGVIQTDDQGYAIVSFSGKEYPYNYDIWLIKVDKDGDHQWDQTFSNSGRDDVADLIQTNDKGYVIIGSSGNYYDTSHLWVIKTDENGQFEWDTLYIGDYYERGISILQTDDGDFVFTGHALISETNEDIWVVKTKYETTTTDDATTFNSIALLGSLFMIIAIYRRRVK